MGKIGTWKKTNERKDMILWQNGARPQNPLHMWQHHIRITKTTPYIQKNFGNVWDVDSDRRINNKTVHGKVVSFKTKAKALEFVSNHMRKYPRG